MLTLLIWLTAIFILALVWRTVLWKPRPVTGLTEPITHPHTRLVGHRGVRGSLPENSLEAFKAAFDAGLDGIEFDVQQSIEGELLIYHDFDMPDGRPVAYSSLEALQYLDEHIPTLDQLFELAKEYPGRLLNLEIKSAGFATEGLERNVVKAVRASGLTDRVLVSSFNPLSLLHVRLRAPEIRTAFLYYNGDEVPKILRSKLLAGWLHVDALHPYVDDVTAELVSECKRLGLACNVWTVNDADDVKRLVNLGVDAIMADDPAALKAAALSGNEGENDGSQI